MKRRAKRVILICLLLVGIGAGTWALWPERHWPETTLDLGNNVKMRLVQIPAGKFMMGSPDGEPNRDPNEGPQHEVTISKPFYMGVFEVTQEQYQQVMGVNPSRFQDQPANPVENVSWDDAMEFCKKLSAKTGKKVTLPTEAQWEYACRAGTTTPFNTGDDLRADQANMVGGSVPEQGPWGKFKDWIAAFFPTKARACAPTPVGNFPPNNFGLYDMHGNALEWCADWYDKDYYANSPKTDPKGPSSGECRVQRGGAWRLGPSHCRSALRVKREPFGYGDHFGFRVVVSSGLD